MGEISQMDAAAALRRWACSGALPYAQAASRISQLRKSSSAANFQLAFKYYF
jgi:hypothetical protein